MKFFLAFAILSAVTSTGFAAETAAFKLPSKKKLHIYLLMGQSNMAGRGPIGEEDKKTHPRVLKFAANNTWEIAEEPIHKDRPGVKFGVGPGGPFGKIVAEKDSRITIGLVPCAVGGTPLSRWEKGADLYSNAVARAKQAMKDGTLKGILWHQGENDSIREETANTYEERLVKMIGDIRADLKAPKLPFVVAQIGEFLYTRKDPTKTPFAKNINASLANIPSKVPHTACVKASGLKDHGDEVHFDTASQRELGKRFAEEMLRLQKSGK